MRRHEDLVSEDRDLERLFAPAGAEMPGGDFTAAVMARIRASRRRRAIRVGVLGVAAGAGLVFAAGPVAEMLADARHWDPSAWVEMYRLPLVVAVGCLLAWPALARIVGR